jgi:hypothetical protein
MKTNLDKHLTAIALSIALPILGAQAAEPENKQSGGNTGTSNPPTNRNTPAASNTTGLGSIKDSPLSDPETLFKRLDTNHDGNLSREEFLQIHSVLQENKPVPKPAYDPKGS